MHILLIHQAFTALNEPGGTRHHELASSLAAHGHRVTVIASPVSYLTGSRKTDATPADTPGVTVLRTATYTSIHRSFVRRLFAFLNFMLSSFRIGLGVRRVDLVWGTSPPIFQGVTAWALSRLKGVPFLFEVRDLWPQFAIAVGVLRSRVLISASLWLERFLYRRADQVMVNSPGYVEHVKKRGAKRVTLVPNSANPEMFDPSADGAVFRSSHGLQGFVVLYAGAHGMSNDLGVVLETARLLQTQAPEVCIVLLGDGKEKPALQAQASAMGLTNIVFLPPVPKVGMGQALAAADACLAILKPLDEYKTTYPNKVFDYMAAGRPVVLAIDGVIRQVVESAGCGLFTPPGDPQAMAEAIIILKRDPVRSRQMGLAGRSYLEAHFDRDQVAESLRSILEGMQRGG